MNLELLQRQNRELRERVEELEEENRQLREARDDCREVELPDWVPYLTRTEKHLLVALSDGRLHSRSQLMNLLYGLKASPPDEKIIDAFICKLRAKLATAPVPIEIITSWRQGWQMSRNSVAALRSSDQVAA